MKRPIHALHFIRFGGPKSPEACLTTSEIDALRRIVASNGGDSDAFLSAPGLIRVAGAYLHLLDEHTGMQRALSRLLAGPEVH